MCTSPSTRRTSTFESAAKVLEKFAAIVDIAKELPLPKSAVADLRAFERMADDALLAFRQLLDNAFYTFENRYSKHSIMAHHNKVCLYAYSFIFKVCTYSCRHLPCCLCTPVGICPVVYVLLQATALLFMYSCRHLPGPRQ